MEITRETVNQWLEHNRRSQKWLAEQCGVSDQAVSNWLRESNHRPISAAAQITIRRLMDEDAARQQAAPLQNLVLEFEGDQFGAIEQAALAGRQTVREWAKDVLNGAATMDVDAFVAEFFPDRVARFHTSADESAVASFPIPLLRAAAGFPILSDAEVIEHDRELGDGRFLLELRGDSMEPRFHDRQRVVLRDKATLRRPVLKYKEFYCFIHEGAACFKQWAKDGEGRKVLRSLNPEHPDVPADEATEWIGWFDPADNA